MRREEQGQSLGITILVKRKRRLQNRLRSFPQREKNQEAMVSQARRKKASRGPAPQQSGSQEQERFEMCSVALASGSHGDCVPLGVKVCE